MSQIASERGLPVPPVQRFRNDPYGLTIYTLKNGLTLYLSPQSHKPRIETRVVVRAGSSNDPSESTGAAHILEHLMFKGSGKIGAVRPEEEAEYLSRISGLFNRLRRTEGDGERKALFGEIDRLNQKTSCLALPGEYDRILAHLGARGVNAYTGLEETVYRCDIPSVELERWVRLEAERFSNPVMRSFLTEIEAIYEEFNQDQDDDFSRARELLLERLFPGHPYGDHSILGREEHIKAPALDKIEEFRRRWYRPEHMAVCLAGDFDPDQAASLFESWWGGWMPSPEPSTDPQGEAAPLAGKKRFSLYGPDSEFSMTGFRFGGIRSDEYNLLVMLDLILNNSQAGLIDLNLVQKQKLLEGGSSLSNAGDYSWFVLYGTPGPGQSLGSVHRLLLKQIDMIRKGNFDARLLKGIVKLMEIERIQDLESNLIVDAFAESFAEKIPWEEYLSRLDKLRSITKDDLIRFARTRFRDGFIRVDKKEGEDPDVVKMEKPGISPVRIDYNRESDFFTGFRTQAPDTSSPLFPDYSKELVHSDLSPGVGLTSGVNKKNDLFELTFIFPEGRSASPILPIAGDYLPYIGTDRMSPEELQKEAFFLGIDLSVQVDLDRTVLSLFGKQRDFSRAVSFLHDIIRRGEGSSRSYRKYVHGLLKRRRDAKLSKKVLLFGGLYSWGLYGEDSPFRDAISEKELRNLGPDVLMNELRRLFHIPHHIYYYGRADRSEIESRIREFHPGDPACTEQIRPARVYREKKAEGRVYFTHHEMVQAELFRLAPVSPFSSGLLAPVSLFNEFFGAGLNSLVFQEIREARGLAYNAYSSITVPDNPANQHVLHSFLGTQADKLPDALGALDSLLGRIPDERTLYQEAQTALVKSQASERIIDSDVFWSWWEAKEMKLDPQFREEVFQELKSCSFERMRGFFQEYVLPGRGNLLVLGSRDELDLKTLEKMGEFRELTPEELFNY